MPEGHLKKNMIGNIQKIINNKFAVPKFGLQLFIFFIILVFYDTKKLTF